MSDYNGWTNYETWNVNLWVSNDEGLYNEKMRVLRRSHEVSAKTVREFFAEVMGGTTPDLDSLQENGETVDPINFDEIAEHWEDERLDMEKLAAIVF